MGGLGGAMGRCGALGGVLVSGVGLEGVGGASVLVSGGGGLTYLGGVWSRGWGVGVSMPRGSRCH